MSETNMVLLAGHVPIQARPSVCNWSKLPLGLQTLSVIKIQVSIHQEKVISEHCQTVTVGPCELY